MDIEQFLDMQLQLQVKMAEANPTQEGNPYAMTDEKLAQFLTWNVTALNSELSEMLNEVGWKPWASSRHLNYPEALHEMVDAFHFFLNIMLAIGAWTDTPIDEIASEFSGYYQEKNAKNLQRQVDGYDLSLIHI